MKASILLLAATAGCSLLCAQSNPLSSAVQQNYRNVSNNLLKAAEEMPEADYSFKPGPGSRTFGEAVMHVAMVQGMLCGAARGEDKKIDTTKTDKTAAVAALKESMDECGPAYEALTDANGLEMGKMFGRPTPKFNILNMNVVHDNEMYGTIAVYLRAKDLVPPSSAGRGGMKKK